MNLEQLNLVSRSKSGYYKFEDVPEPGLPSVTTIEKVVGKPALINWAAKIERELVLETATSVYTDCLSLKEPLPPQSFTMSIATRLGNAKQHEKTLAIASDIGSAVHKRVEWEIGHRMGIKQGEEPPLSGGARTGFGNFLNWYDAQDIEPLMSEQVVRSLKHGYAGTMDLLARVSTETLKPGGGLTAGKLLTVVDWKTSSGIYFEAAMQVSAYRAALIEMGHANFETWGMIVRLPKTEKDQTQVRVFSPGEMAGYFDTFVHVRALWEAQKAWEESTKAAKKEAK